MFKDSAIASQFEMGWQKCSYFVKLDLAPYFRDFLSDEVKASPYFSVCFDEALNKCMHQQQMDIQLRYWCCASNRVKVRYWDSKFKYGSPAEVLLQTLNEGLKSLDSKKMIQLSMDGPNVNWSIFSKLQKQREEEELPPLEEVGSCHQVRFKMS